MRVKTDAKRSELLNAATEVFLEQGYDRTLMAHVSDRAKCSKGTLYSYFSSKEELFCQAVLDATTREASAVFVELGPTDVEAEVLLLKFGVGFLKAVYSPRFQALRRLLFAANVDSDIGRTVYEQAVRPYEMRVAELLASAMKSNQLRREDPVVAASHLLGLLESELLLKFLLHALDSPTSSTLRAAAQRATSAFLAAYRK
ncbi:A-factor receptor protein [compost metagenome]